MMVFPVIICVVRISQWSIHKWEPDEMGTFCTCGTLASLRTNSESAPCLQEQTEEEWRKQKSVWMQQTDQRGAWREVLWCFCIFVSAVEFSVENSPALKKSVRQRKTLLEKKWRTKLKPETSREDGEEQKGSSGAPSVRGAGVSGKPGEELRCS